MLEGTGEPRPAVGGARVASFALLLALSGIALHYPALGFASVSPAPSVAAPFVNEVVVPGITSATTMAFLPDGRMIVGELTEKVWVVLPGQNSPKATPFLNLPASGLQGEQGLLDILVDPDFATNRWYYVYYTRVTGNGNYNRVSRFTATATGDSTNMASETVLWQDDNVANLEHHGGGLTFGPGGKLFIAVGEAFYPADAQVLSSYRGKLLRINPDGTIPTDNPFYDGNGTNKDEIYCYGLRNPFRISYDSVLDKVFIGDVGGNDNNVSMEEINVAAPGANFGWPNCEGACGGSVTSPLYAYPHSGRDAAVIGGFVYRGGNFPAAYQGSYFFGDYAQNWIKRLTLDGSGNLTGVVNFEPDDGSADGPYGDPTKLIQGPDGALYYVDIGFTADYTPNEAAIRRIRYAAGNQPPVVVADATPKVGQAPLTVAFTSAGSYDPEGQTLSYSWAFGDATTSTLANPSHLYSASGTYTALLTVSDGISSSLSSPITIVAGTPPTSQITSPPNGAFFIAGQAIAFSGTATDRLGNPIPASGYTWTILFHHETHVHPGGSYTGVTGGTFVIPSSGHDFSGNTSYEFVLTVTDSDGLHTTKSVTIYPDKVNLSFSTTPTGFGLDVDGIRKTAPFVIDALKGFHYTINAPTQTVGGQMYDFQSWSDGGARSHSITVPTTNASYAATFAPIAGGLVAAYAFAEGSGTMTADRSGNNNSGTLSNTVWTTQGKFGSALIFNGTNAKVTIPDAAWLHLTKGMTLEAWVYPATMATSWADVIMKQGDDYYLAGSSQSTGGVPATGGTYTTPLYAASSLPPNAWSHLAATYDGTMMRLYVNGIQAGSRANTNTMSNSNGPLSIGGDALFGQYFNGRIDEVRVYNRALSASEIQADMTNPILTAVEGEAAPPAASAILRASPNPFNPITDIRFRLASSAGARLRIADVSGRVVRTFDLRHFPPGEHQVQWDGNGDQGLRLASGVYIARLEAADGAKSLRLVLVR